MAVFRTSWFGFSAVSAVATVPFFISLKRPGVVGLRQEPRF